LSQYFGKPLLVRPLLTPASTQSVIRKFSFLPPYQRSGKPGSMDISALYAREKPRAERIQALEQGRSNDLAQLGFHRVGQKRDAGIPVLYPAGLRVGRGTGDGLPNSGVPGGRQMANVEPLKRFPLLGV
jgi:hypothetical protein